MLQRHPGVVDPPDFYPPDNDVLASLPLVKFKVMRWETTGETSFHIRFCHALGEFGISDYSHYLAHTNVQVMDHLLLDA